MFKKAALVSGLFIVSLNIAHASEERSAAQTSSTGKGASSSNPTSVPTEGAASSTTATLHPAGNAADAVPSKPKESPPKDAGCDSKPKVNPALDPSKIEAKAAEDKALLGLGLVKPNDAATESANSKAGVVPSVGMETCK